MSIELENVTSGYNLSLINTNFQKVEDYINDKVLHRGDSSVAGEAKMERDLDMNGFSILNADLNTSSLTNDRAIRVPVGEGSIDALPSAEDRKGKALTFDINTGLPIVSVPASGSAIDVLNQLAASGDSQGDALVSVKQPVTNSVLRTQHSYNADRVSVKDFGAVGNGVTDDAVAIENAFNSGKQIYIPAGVYILSRKINIAGGQSIVGSGTGITELRFTGATGGIEMTLAANPNSPFLIADFSLTTTSTAAANQRALMINGVAQFSGEVDGVGHQIIGNRTSKRGHIRNISVHGVNVNTQAWAYGLYFKSVMNFSVDGYYFTGLNTVNAYTSTGIFFGGDGVPVDVSFRRLWIYYATFALYMPDYAEGIHVTDFEFINVTYGIHGGVWSTESTVANGITGALAVYAHHGHIYCRALGINLNNTNQNKLDNLVIYNQPTAAESVSYAIRLVNGGYNDISSIYSNMSNSANTSSNNRSIVLETISSSNVRGVSTIGPCQSCVTLTGNSGYNNIDMLNVVNTTYVLDEVGGANILNYIGASLTGTYTTKRINLPVNPTTNRIQYKRVQVTGTATLAGQVATVNITPPETFDAKPRAVSVGMAYSSTGVITGYYDYDASTTTNLVIQLRGNSNGPTEAVRYFVDYPLS